MSTISQSCCVEEVLAGSIAGSVLALLYLVGSWMVGGAAGEGVSSGMYPAAGVPQSLPQEGGGGVAGEGVSSDMYTAAGASQPLGGGGGGLLVSTAGQLFHVHCSWVFPALVPILDL